MKPSVSWLDSRKSPRGRIELEGRSFLSEAKQAPPYARQLTRFCHPLTQVCFAVLGFCFPDTIMERPKPSLKLMVSALYGQQLIPP
ncbi:hypothetical protein SAMN05216337_105823 [Bradyrhizobium brasilense]|uniref:Uncharacterized protein n=1 Tax=Bradyrhizobium brasilense TaxID=1419277 RepID=A0A1G7LJN1_9BRAD|nr:hypothetical protein SAMN05216337_105823 [Bradyrhizobium brasilense]